LFFYTTDGQEYMMYHEQDCCESVYLEELCGGDLDDLVGSPITMAECVTEDRKEGKADGYDYDFSGTWTFYKFATNQGYITLRWVGTSNGYYSESVDFVLKKKS
jgi:hypothetical protein